MIPNEALLGKLEPFLLPLVVCLVALGAFGLGRLSALEQKGELRVLSPALAPAEPMESMAAVAGAGTPSSAKATEGSYVASKNGSKYYLVTCSSAGRIKQENRVYFVSAGEAQAAGYEPAANCPGL